MPELTTQGRGNDMRITLYPVRQSAEIARTFVRHRLLVLGIPPERVDDGCVIASELVTNVCKHVPYARIFHLSVRKNDQGCLIEVWDPSPARPMLIDDPSGESGRGLLIVSALARTWYHNILPPENGGGKIVAAVL